ncbi:dnaJ homolog subfamily C member 9-like [Sycon ciliatum]|uniref:dnaJ homolog subfamily C member 9-like n=1 Tax=Sycon ciliatum TaxID=27933 RepID=UPI0020ADC0A5|eukprot:scpid74934/ scgid29756/ DnaJ homolog subfamily C member 9
MSSFLDTVEELYETRDLYHALGLTKTASDAEIKKHYYKASLKVHPDRVEESEKEFATRKFQVLVKLYGVLSDKEKRALYDEQGIVDDEDSAESDKDWYDYWRLRFTKITVDDIEAFAKTYRDSEEEKSDLKEAYVSSNGSMEEILTKVLCSTYEDEDRFRVLIDGWIKAKEVPKFKAYAEESKRSRKRRRKAAQAEAAEAEEALAAIGGVSGDENSLSALIKRRQAQREGDADSFFASLEAKYASGGKAKSKAKAKKQESKSAPSSKRSKKS